MQVRRNHQAAAIDAEVRRLVHALEPWEVIPLEQLEQRVHADCWHEPWFESALQAAIQRGVVELLYGGFVALRGFDAGSHARRELTDSPAR